MESEFNKWIEEGLIPEEHLNNALNMLKSKEENIESLLQYGKPWEAYGELMACIALFNATAQQYPAKRPSIIQRLLTWIKNIKSTLDKIINGIGGNGYSIGVSMPWGVSVSVSFPVTRQPTQ